MFLLFKHRRRKVYVLRGACLSVPEQSNQINPWGPDRHRSAPWSACHAVVDWQLPSQSLTNENLASVSVPLLGAGRGGSQALGQNMWPGTGP